MHAPGVFKPGMSFEQMKRASLSTTRAFLGDEKIPCYLHRVPDEEGVRIFVEFARTHAGFHTRIAWPQGDFLCDQRGIFQTMLYGVVPVPVTVLCSMRWGMEYMLDALQTYEAAKLEIFQGLDPLTDSVFYKVTHTGDLLWLVSSYGEDTSGRHRNHRSGWLRAPGMESAVMGLEGGRAL